MSLQVRPMTPDDVVSAHALSFSVFTAQDAAAGRPVPEHTEQRRRRGELRVAHMQRTDPAGAWVAADDDVLVGVALATVRGPLWFLSLLVVAEQHQGRGLGRRLLDAALAHGQGSPAGAICSSDDPRALRRYSAAGFDLHPCYAAQGGLERSRLPAVHGVRDGDWATDRERVDALAVELRGAPHGPDLDVFTTTCDRLLVAEGPAGCGYALVGSHGVSPLAASTPAAARALLITGLAGREEPEAEVSFLTAADQWALTACRELGLALRPSESRCVRGSWPAGCYLPNGAFG